MAHWPSVAVGQADQLAVEVTVPVTVVTPFSVLVEVLSASAVEDQTDQVEDSWSTG